MCDSLNRHPLSWDTRLNRTHFNSFSFSYTDATMALYSWSKLLAREKCDPFTSSRSNEDFMEASTSISSPEVLPPPPAAPVLIRATMDREETVPPQPELLLFSLWLPMKVFSMFRLKVVVGLTVLMEVLAACEVAALMDLPNPSSSTVVDEEPML